MQFLVRPLVNHLRLLVTGGGGLAGSLCCCCRAAEGMTVLQDKLVHLLAATAGSQTPASLRRLMKSASSDTFVASIKHVVIGKGGSSEEQR